MGHNHTTEIRAEITNAIKNIEAVDTTVISTLQQKVTNLEPLAQKVSNLEAIKIPYSTYTNEDAVNAAAETPTKAEFDAVVALLNETKTLLNAIFTDLATKNLMEEQI